MASVINLETGLLEEKDDDEIIANAAGQPLVTEQIAGGQPEGQVIDLESGQVIETSTRLPVEQPVVEPEEAVNPVSDFLRNIPGFGNIEPILGVASGLIAEPIAGLEGLGRVALSPLTGETADEIAGGIEERRDQLTFDVKSPGGLMAMQILGQLVEEGVDIASLPAQGLQGLSALLSGLPPEVAAQQIAEMKEKGVGQFLGDNIFQTTGSETAAAITTALPTALASLFGVKKVPRKPTVPGAEDVIATGKSTGVDVLTTDVLPPTTAAGKLGQTLAERIPFVGTGQKRGVQRQQRIDAIEQLQRATPETTPADIFESLQGSVNKRKQAAGKRLNTLRTQIEDGVPFQAELRSGERAIDDAVTQLNRKGAIKDQNFISGLDDLSVELIDATEGGFESLRTFRTDFRSKIVESVDPTGRSQLSSFEKVQMDKVMKGITDDLDAMAKEKLTPQEFVKYKQADKVWAEEARLLTKSRLKTVLDKGDVKPELIDQLLFSSSPSEVKLLHRTLGQSGRDNARFALLNRAFKNSEVKGEISPERFLTQLDKMEANFDVFFRGEAGREVQGLRKLLQATRRADAAGVVTPTGQQLLAPLAAMMTGASFFSAPVAAGTIAVGSVGAIGRLFESSLVRNRLVRAANATDQEIISIARELPILIEAAIGEQQPIEEQ